MRCSRCGSELPEGAVRCPVCGVSSRYGGNTEFFGKAVASSLTLKSVFSDVFKSHPKSDGERLFMAGTGQSTPREDEMLREWRKPWVFARVLLIGICVSILLYLLAYYTDVAYPGFLMVGSFVMPLATLMFYWEMNIPRNIPLYSVLLMFLVGGAISLVISIVFFQLVPLSSENASFAAFCEEPGKLLALSIFLRKSDKKYGLNGILVGGSIGAGFAAMESLGYAFLITLQGGAEYGVSNILLRGVLAPGGHVVWAALYGGALALAKGRENLRPAHFADPTFLGCFGISVALHFAWNSGISILPIPVFGDLFYILLTVLAWAALFWIMNKGIRQVVAITNSYGTAGPLWDNPPFFAGAEQAAAAAPVFGQQPFNQQSLEQQPFNQQPLEQQPFNQQPFNQQPINQPPLNQQPFVQQPSSLDYGREAKVVCLTGVYAGQTFPCGTGTFVFGRETSVCNLVFPDHLAGVSRKHCVLEYQNGSFYLSDCNSSFGTYLGDGRRLNPGEQVQLFSGHRFYMGNELFEVRC